MIEASELMDSRELIDRDRPDRSLVAVPSLSLDGDWTLGYDDVLRAAHAFARGAAFLSRHWEELDADTRSSLLRSIEATAHDVTRLLGGSGAPDRSVMDEALEARVGSL
jgi:hypothetical protein